MRVKIICALLLFSTVACGRSDSGPKPEIRGGGETRADWVRQQAAEIIRKVKQVMAETPCVEESQPCTNVDRYGPDFWENNQDQPADKPVIMILDSDVSFFEAGRYSKRVLFTIAQNTDTGIYEPVRKKITVPEHLSTILDLLQGSGFIPAAALSELHPLLENISIPVDYTGSHGKISFQYLVENSPESTLITGTKPDLFKPYKDLICSNSMDEYREALRRTGESLVSTFIRPYGVQYLNYSLGHTPSGISQELTELCEGSPERPDLDAVVKAVKVFYSYLFATPGLLTVQAATIEQENELDCGPVQESPNRIRSAFFLDLDSGLDPEGRPTNLIRWARGLPAIPGIFSRIKDQCIDVFVNFGLEKEGRDSHFNETPFRTNDILGVSEKPIAWAYPSWTPPLVISYLNYLRQTHFRHRAFDNSLIQDLKKALTPDKCQLYYQGTNRCVMQDPLLHRQTMLHQWLNRVI